MNYYIIVLYGHFKSIMLFMILFKQVVLKRKRSFPLYAHLCGRYVPPLIFMGSCFHLGCFVPFTCTDICINGKVISEYSKSNFSNGNFGHIPVIIELKSKSLLWLQQLLQLLHVCSLIVSYRAAISQMQPTVDAHRKLHGKLSAVVKGPARCYKKVYHEVSFVL